MQWCIGVFTIENQIFTNPNTCLQAVHQVQIWCHHEPTSSLQCGLHPAARLPSPSSRTISYLSPEGLSSAEGPSVFWSVHAATCASLPTCSSSATVEKPSAIVLVYPACIAPTQCLVGSCTTGPKKSLLPLCLCRCTAQDLVQVDAPLRPSDPP